jgi:AraC-like DNA-binding protein
LKILSGERYFTNRQFPFYIGKHTISKGEVVPAHIHDFVELTYVVSGNSAHELSGNSYRLRSGNVLVLEPDAYHSYSGSMNEDTVVYNVLFDVGFLQKELDVMLQIPSFVGFFYLAPFLRKNETFIPYLPLKEDQKIRMESQLEAIHEEFKERREGYQLIIKTRLIEILVWLSRFYETNRDEQAKTVSDEEWMLSIKKFVELHHQQPLSLRQLSRTCGMSVASFTAKFKETTGQSMVDYKHSVQIRHARSLLSETSRKILDIAHEVGFNDISFFNRVFRKHTGMTPKEYRNDGS